MRLLDRGVESPHVVNELAGELVSHVLDRGQRLVTLEELISVGCLEFLGNSAW